MKFVFLLTSVVLVILFAGCNPLQKKSKAGLQVITNDTPSSVFLNDQYLDKAPLINRDLLPGEYQLSIQPDDPKLVPFETKITLRKGLLTVVTWKSDERPELSGGVIYEMEPLKSKNQSEVSFVTIPDSAIVQFSDFTKQFSPYIFTDVSPGQHEFEVSLPSYETQQHTIDVAQGYRMLITIKLAKSAPVDSLEAVITNETETSLSDLFEASDSAETNQEISSAREASLSAQTKTVTIESTNYFQDGKEVLRVRDQPTPEGETLGFAPVGEEYTYLNETSNSWFKIDFNGAVGWVSGTYSSLK